MQIKAEEVSSIIRDQIQSFEKQVNMAEVGTVLQVGDSIAKIYGLDNAMAGELLEFPGGIKGTEGGYIPLMDYLVNSISRALAAKK